LFLNIKEIAPKCCTLSEKFFVEKTKPSEIKWETF